MNKIVHLEPLPNNSSGLNFADMTTLQDKIIAAVKTVYDPEIPVNIYDLGLIYKIEINDENGEEVKSYCDV